MDVIFQQAPFDDKKDLKRIEEISKEVEQRAKRTPGYRMIGKTLLKKALKNVGGF